MTRYTPTFTLYAFSGLGADARVFESLDLPCRVEVVEWVKPGVEESLSSYASRLANEVNTRHPFGLLGVSFGGAIVQEVASIVQPEFSVLVSAPQSSASLTFPGLRRLLSRSLLVALPTRWFVPPTTITQFLFGSTSKSLLAEILRDTDPTFAKWATLQLMCWKGAENNTTSFWIHGDRDRLIRAPHGERLWIVEGGQHFMIVDRADEVSMRVREFLADAGF